jgi:hypothetical protein
MAGRDKRQRSASRNAISAEYLRKILDYDPAAGCFVWKKSQGSSRAGEIAGTVNKPLGHIHIMIDRVWYYAHRLAWLHVHGEWPRSNLDHINGIPSDNRIVNLRCATQSQNRMNAALRRDNKAQLKGVYFETRRSKWRATINRNRRTIFLGRYATAHEAHQAYVFAAKKLHGEFFRLK